MKVTIVGAGNVGSTVANVVALKKMASEVVLLDIKDGVSEGKTMDMMQAANLIQFDTRITGYTDDYSKTADSDVVVITSGVPRKPGMSREELVGINAGIVQDVLAKVLEYSPKAIFIIISNPMDTMTYLAVKNSGIDPTRAIGLGGLLDSSRFKYYLCRALHCATTDIDAMVIGGHGDTTMIPFVRLANYRGIPIENVLDKAVIDKVVADTMVGGATLTKLIGTSAWYAPGAAAAVIVEAIATDSKRLIPCSVYLDGEYGLKDICIGVPVILGKNGVEKIVEVKLTQDEQRQLEQSAASIRSVNKLLDATL